jgi:molecular chaperone GrpE
MNPDDEFEFEIDDEDDDFDEEKEDKSPKKSKKVSKSINSPKKSPKKTNSKPPKKASRTPIPDGVKRKIALDMREIKKLKKELGEYKDEKETLEHELEMLEDEIDNLRSEKIKFEDDVNKQVALANAFEKKLNRNQKDFDNFKKRNENELDKKIRLGSKKLIMGVIDVLDNLDRAITESKRFDYKPEVKQIIEGVESIRKSLLKVLGENDVEMIDPIDEAFNPHFHEAIEMRMDRSVMENTVVDVDSKGYMLGELVLRPAKVYVSKGGDPRKKKSKKIKDREEEEDEEIEEVEDIGDIDDLDEIMEEIDDLDSD